MDRDTKICEWETPLSNWCTTATDPTTTDYTARSDGTTNENYGVMEAQGLITATANQMFANCVYMQPPKEGDELTPYSISVSALVEDETLRPVLFIGMAPASYGASGAGQQSTICRIIKPGKCDLSGGVLNADFVIALGELPTADRQLTVGLGFMAGKSAGTGDAWARLEVRRLLTLEPTIIDAQKLG